MFLILCQRSRGQTASYEIKIFNALFYNQMNVYRMRPAHPEFDWFEHNKEKGIMKYDTGERLADFDDKGRGRWYYRNGGVALDYYDAEGIFKLDYDQKVFVTY